MPFVKLGNNVCKLCSEEIWFNKVKINNKDFIDKKEQRSQDKMTALQGLNKN